MAVAKYWDEERVRWIVVGDPPQFYDDKFTATGGAQTLWLSYVPISQSEHVFRNGVFQAEYSTWTRTRTSNLIQILPAMGTQSGDKIDVEYAYRTQDTHVNTAPPDPDIDPGANGNQIYWMMDTITERGDGPVEWWVRNRGTYGSKGDGFLPAHTVAVVAPLVSGSTGALRFTNGYNELVADIPCSTEAVKPVGMEYHISFAINVTTIFSHNDDTTPMAIIGYYQDDRWVEVLNLRYGYGTNVYLTVDGTQQIGGSVLTRGVTSTISASISFAPCWATSVDSGGGWYLRPPMTATLSLAVDGVTTTDTFPFDPHWDRYAHPADIETLTVSVHTNAAGMDVTLDEIRAGWSGSYIECAPPPPGGPHIVIPGASSYPYAGGTNPHYMPPATGFPILNYGAQGQTTDNTQVVYWTALFGSGADDAVASVPGLIPESAYARKSFKNDNRQGAESTHMVVTNTGPGNQYHVGLTTAFGMYTWFEALGAHTPASPLTEYFLTFSQETRWYTATTPKSVYHALRYSDLSNSWWISITNAGTFARYAIPNIGNPHTPGTHFIQFYVDCAAQTMTGQFDGNTFSFTHPEVWRPNDYVGEIKQPAGYISDEPRTSTLRIYGATGLITDSFTIHTDAPFEIF